MAALCRLFFSFGRIKKWSLVELDRWLYYRVTIVWEFAWPDSALAVLGKWSSYRDGHMNRFDCSIKCYWSNAVYFSLCVFLPELYQRIFTMRFINWYYWWFYFYRILYNIYWNLCHLWRIRIDIYRISLLFSCYSVVRVPAPASLPSAPSPLFLLIFMSFLKT